MKKYLLLMTIALCPVISFGWNAQGHKTAGVVAYDYLKAHNPQVIAKITKTLSYHPWYNSRWADAIKDLQGEQRDIALFELASTFPDDARGTDLGSGEKSKWHYIDYPYVPAGSTAKGKDPELPNAQAKILELLETLKSESDGEQRALDVCWLFHLIEDVHQPLHATMMFDDNHPDGDKGGNTVFIKLGVDQPQNLHHYWDAIPVADNDTCTVKAVNLMNEYPESSLNELKHPDVVYWIKDESYELAIKDVYRNGKVNGTKDNPTHLMDDYEQNARKVAQRRLVLSGMRLAKKLADIYS
jgi:S1/P1 Nuclease